MAEVIVAGLVVGVFIVIVLDIGRRAYLMQRFPHAYKAEKADRDEHEHYAEERQATVAEWCRKTIVLRPLAKYFEP